MLKLLFFVSVIHWITIMNPYVLASNIQADTSEVHLDSVIVDANEGVSIGTISLQVLLGNLGGIGLGSIGGLIGEGLRDKDGPPSTGIGIVVGYSIGTTLGVYLIGDNNYKNGSFIPALLGSMIGTSLMTLIALNNDNLPLITTVALLEITPAITILAYYLFGYSEENESNILELSNYKINFAIPSIDIIINRFSHNNVYLKLNLISVKIN